MDFHEDTVQLGTHRFLVTIPTGIRDQVLDNNFGNDLVQQQKYEQAFAAASNLPIAQESLPKALSWLNKRCLNLSTDEASVASLLCSYMNNNEDNPTSLSVYLELAHGALRPIKGLLKLTIIAFALNIRIYLFSTRKKPIIIVNNLLTQTQPSISILHYIDSFEGTSQWLALAATDEELIPVHVPPQDAAPTTQLALRRQVGAKKPRATAVHWKTNPEQLRDVILHHL